MKIAYLTMKNVNTEPVIGSLLSTGRECQIIEFDKINNWALIHNVLQGQKPDVIIYNSVAAGESLPSVDILKRIGDVAPFVHLCFDGSCPDWHSLLEQYAKQDVFKKTINIDGNNDWPSRSQDITWLCPVDTRPYEYQWPYLKDRIVKLGFCGGTGSKSRRDLLDKLGVLVTKREHKEALSGYQAYADFLRNCQCILNMSQSGTGRSSQVKARVLETGLARACLFEEKNGITARWFRPNLDYIEYEDALDIATILEEDDVYKFELLADNLHQQVTTKYSADIFWMMALE